MGQSAMDAVMTEMIYKAATQTMQANGLDPVDAAEVYMRMLVMHIGDTSKAGREHIALDKMVPTLHEMLTRYIGTMSQIGQLRKLDKPEIPQ